jgi:single-strand DNA-binding protein
MIIAIAAGRIARDAELRTTKSDKSVCSFTVACDAGYGENKRTEWIKVAIFGKRADGLSPYLKKGTALTVQGEAKSNSWISKSGEAQGEIEIFADKVTLQGSKQGNYDSQASDDVPNNSVDEDIPF